MGAEGKYDLQLSASHDAEKLKPPPKVEQGAVGGVKQKQVGVSTEKSKVSNEDTSTKKCKTNRNLPVEIIDWIVHAL